MMLDTSSFTVIITWIMPLLITTSIMVLPVNPLTAARVNSRGYDEYCETEIFEPSCGPGEVIIMKSAKYGRMNNGRCIDRDWGYLGCSVDVMVLADRWCSGRRSCQIPIPNSSFRKTLYSDRISSSCPRDLNPYFEASFHCVKVETAESQNCSSSAFILPSSPSFGMLANYVTMETEKGSDRCPWIIQAKRGQRVNITLYDFAREEADEVINHNTGYPGYDICHVYAVLRERADTGLERREYSVCGGGFDREKSVYVTEGHSVEIKVVPYRSPNDPKYFLIKYEVSGCESPDDIPPHTWMKRMDQDQIMIGCRNTDHRWIIRCVNSQWDGEVGNCTHNKVAKRIGFVQLLLSVFSLPLEYSLLVVAGIALAIGVVTVTLGICCAKALCGKKSKKSCKKQHARRNQNHNIKNKPIQAVHPTTKINSSVPTADSSELLLDETRSSDLDIQSNSLPPPPAFLMDAPMKEKQEMNTEMPPPPPPSPPMNQRQLPKLPTECYTPPPPYEFRQSPQLQHQTIAAPLPAPASVRGIAPDFIQQLPNLHQQHHSSSPKVHHQLSSHDSNHVTNMSPRRLGHRRMPSDVTVTIERSSPKHNMTCYKTYNPRSTSGYQSTSHSSSPRSAGYQPNPHSSFEFPPPPPEVLRQLSEPGLEKHRVRFQDMPVCISGFTGKDGDNSGSNGKYQGLQKPPQQQQQKQKIIRNNNKHHHDTTKPEFNGIKSDKNNHLQSYGSFSQRILNAKPPTEATVTLNPRHSGDEKTYFELEPEGPSPSSSSVPYEIGYSVKTGQKFKVYRDEENNRVKGKKIFDPKSPKKHRVITNSTV